MKTKIEAKTLLPAIIHFAETYLTEDDFKVLKKCLKADDIAEGIKDDPIVKAGGLQKILESFLKSNKEITKKLTKQNASKKRKSSKVDSDDEE